MKKLVLVTGLLFVCVFSIVAAQNTVALKLDEKSAQLEYAAKVLQARLEKQGFKISQKSGEYEINFGIDAKSCKAEAFQISPQQNTIQIKGGDGRGVIYGAYALAEALKNGAKLNNIQARQESTKLHFRAIKFDLPWDTYRHSSALTQHQETCRDLEYWEAFLDMMAQNRFNTLTLWNLHPYTFLIKPQNFPEASPWNEQEMAEWRHLFKSIFKMAQERGINTYIMPFNIFVTPEFAKAHNVAMHNLEHHHYVKADTSEIIKEYTRQCVTQMLNEYPNLSGIGLTLGEGMGGMTPLEREEWMQETIIRGMSQADRKSKLIHRIPFSGGTESLGATNIEMEQITRKMIENQAAMDKIIKPVWASLKFNWSHGHSTPKLIKVHGGKIYGTYWNPKPEGYKMVWTIRNEDFFCLRWGAADFVRKHINMNAHNYVGGYFIGSETYIPAKNYFTKPGYDVDWQYAFERQWLFYKIWGRLLYNPATPNEIFKAEFEHRYGKPSRILFDAYKLASRTPLRLASSFDCTWDFTLYSEGFLALDPEIPSVKYISVDRQIYRKPLDTSYISIDNYVKNKLKGKEYNEERVTPLELANSLEKDCKKALKMVENLNVAHDTSVMFEVADIKAWSNLGLYFAEKLRGGVALQTYRYSGDQKEQQKAVKQLQKALDYWDNVIEITRPLYKDMPLTHFSEQGGQNWKKNDHLRFHWALLRPQIVNDIEIAKEAQPLAK